jgi:putative ABC transport system substrate-binding protein
MMRRRDFMTMVGGAAALPLVSHAQEPDKILRIGTASTQPRSVPFWRAFEQRMNELGYQEGKNYRFEYLAVPDIDRYESGYREVAARGLDVIIASGPEIALKSAIASSNTIPIVMVAIDYDPFARGYVTSLANPVGNVTGLFLQQIELTAKRLQLLKSEFHDLKAVTVFWDRITADQWEAAQRAGAALGLRLYGVELRDPPYDYEKALAQVAVEDRGTLLVLVSPFFFRDRQRQADVALREHLVSMFGLREWVDAGGLLSYGPSINGMFRRAAEYVDRLARGAKPGDLPIEQPTKFELVINLKTAKTLGLTMPATLLARADEVIE